MTKGETEAHHVLNSRDDLCEDQLGFQVVKLPPRGDSREQVSTAAVLHDQIQLPARLHHLIKAHYVGVAQLLHAADLWGSQRLFLLIQMQLVHDFNSYSLWDRRRGGRRLSCQWQFKEGLMRLRTEIRTDVYLGDLTQEQMRRIWSKGGELAFNRMTVAAFFKVCTDLWCS